MIPTKIITPLVLAAVAAITTEWTFAGDWPQFRGHGATGVADKQDLPESWDTGTMSNVRWKTPIPGLGHASPIVTGDRVFIVTADSGDENPPLRVGLYGDIAPVEDENSIAWRVYCLSQESGRILWRRTLHEGEPKIKRHTKSTHANSTPATDGEHLVVFLGSEGLFCLDLCGNQLWRKDLGVLDSGYYLAPKAQWGFASSPIIYNQMVIVQCDVQKNSFLAAFDIENGQQLWRTARNDLPTWSTPTIFEGSKRTELIVNGYKHAGGYDPQTGKEIWKLSGGGDIPVPTPVTAHRLIFLTNAHGADRPFYAIREGATGEISVEAETPSEHLAWHVPRTGNYMQTPIVYGDYLYGCQDNGVMSCFEARTGKVMYRERLGGGTGFTASPVAADGKLYFANEAGVVHVIQTGPDFIRLGTNPMNDVCMATPAIADGALIIRTANHVYSIGKPTIQPGCQRQLPRRNRRVMRLHRAVYPWRCR